MVLLYLLLIGGVAGRVSLEKIDDWFGSEGYDGGLTSSASDGSRIALTGTQSEDGGYEESYLTVVGDDLDLLLRNNYRTEHLEDVLKEPYIYKFGTLCRNQALVADGEYGVQVEPSEWVLDGYVQVGYFRDSCDDEDLVVLYDDVAIRGGREACDVDLDEALGWSRATSFALSEKSATAYVVGRHKDSDDRAVAAVKMEEDRCEVIWHANIATDEGTPRILAVNNDDRVEILLTSNEFFARVDRGTSSREGGDVKTLLIEKQLWLPGEGEAIVAYSDAEDVIFSAGYVVGKALLRASSADTGRELYEIDFTDELDAKNPYTSRSDYDDDNFDDWKVNQWNQKLTPVIEGIHVLGDKVAVVGAFIAHLYDEGGSHRPFVALFEPAPASDDDDGDDSETTTTITTTTTTATTTTTTITNDDDHYDDDDYYDDYFDDADDFGEDDCEYDNPRVCEADGWYWCCDRDSGFSKCGDSYGFCGSGGVSKKTAKGIAIGIIVAIVVVVVVVIAAIVACCVCCKRRRGETAAAAAARRAPSAPPAPYVVQEAPPQQYLPVVTGQVAYGQGAGPVVKAEVVP